MKHGFTVIEIIIVILIIGVMASVGIPRLMQIGVIQAEQFIARLNELTQAGAQAAQETGKVHKILFNITSKKVELYEIDSKSQKRSIQIPESVEISEFFIDGKSQFVTGSGQKYTAYFLINSRGVTQDVRIILIDHNLQARDPKTGRYEIQLNPFTAQFNII